MLRDQILNVLTTKKKWLLCDVMEVLAKAMMVIILLYMCIKSTYVQLKHTMLYVNYISINLGGGAKKFWNILGHLHLPVKFRVSLPIFN